MINKTDFQNLMFGLPPQFWDPKIFALTALRALTLRYVFRRIARIHFAESEIPLVQGLLVQIHVFLSAAGENFGAFARLKCGF